MQYYHGALSVSYLSEYIYIGNLPTGISPRNGLPYSPPTCFRITTRPLASATKHERTEVLEGKCHRCIKWIALEGIKAGDAKVRFSATLTLLVLMHFYQRWKRFFGELPAFNWRNTRYWCIRTGGSMRLYATKALISLANATLSLSTTLSISTPFHQLSPGHILIEKFLLWWIISKSSDLLYFLIILMSWIPEPHISGSWI